jgi:hypothetical protein
VHLKLFLIFDDNVYVKSIAFNVFLSVLYLIVF